jgi:hypothetical protein
VRRRLRHGAAALRLQRGDERHARLRGEERRREEALGLHDSDRGGTRRLRHGSWITARLTAAQVRRGAACRTATARATAGGAVARARESGEAAPAW